jgi:hypothetical protein
MNTIGDSDPALGEKILDIPEAQCVSQIQPDRMLDEYRRKPIASAAEDFHRKTLPAVTWRGHARRDKPVRAGNNGAVSSNQTLTKLIAL